MRRTAAFDRDFQNLHGERPPVFDGVVIEGEVVGESRSTLPPAPRWAHKMPIAFRIILGSVALFWTVVLTGFLIAAVVVFVVMAWAFLSPSQ